MTKLLTASGKPSLLGAAVHRADGVNHPSRIVCGKHEKEECGGLM
jgi:hypothetical protein